VTEMFGLLRQPDSVLVKVFMGKGDLQIDHDIDLCTHLTIKSLRVVPLKTHAGVN
jgi:hypothetical protein